ncbi:hypothetical protein HNQ72_001739 [Rhizobium wenxiniae]|uniref:Uncharacterized protein n=1 Tax=Rhizobium wenxiniae TaxID=1737357 RepID=A0A7X0CZY7_9HYPH|nr:hypothetical protein [Rhizobium wenxiniae]
MDARFFRTCNILMVNNDLSGPIYGMPETGISLGKPVQDLRQSAM